MTYKLRNFIWLIFLESGTKNPQFDKLVIPYDCQFIVIQSKNATTYALTEIYTLKKRFFALDFGTWTKDFGLRTTDDSFYRRRTNFQSSELRVVANSEIEVSN